MKILQNRFTTVYFIRTPQFCYDASKELAQSSTFFPDLI